MRKYLIFILLIIISLASCNDDSDYSLDKSWVNIATVINPDDDPFFYLQLDDDNTLKVIATSFYNYKPVTGQKVIANYTILNDQPSGSIYHHDVKLNDAYSILTKDIFFITPETLDSIGNDPIGIKNIWISSNYLNIQFYYRGYNKCHFINLVKDKSKEYNDNKIHLEFRHNANKDNEIYRHSGFISFNLNSLFAESREVKEEVNLVIHIKKLDGKDTTREYSYDPKSYKKALLELDGDDYDEGKRGDFE